MQIDRLEQARDRSTNVSVDVANKKAEMAFRTTDAQGTGTSGITLGDLKEGQKVDGVVKKIEEYGLFIHIDGSKLSGLCHKSQVCELLTLELGY